MTREFSAILAGSIISTTLLIAAHVVLWPYRNRLHRTANYVVGVTCMGIGITVIAGLLDAWLLAIAYWCVAGWGGAAIVTCWWIRGEIERRDGHTARADRIIALAKDDHAVQRRPDHRSN